MRYLKFGLILLLASILQIQCSFIAMTRDVPLKSDVLIIKAAGYLEGQKPQSPDAITEATSIGRNVHVVSEVLADQLNEKGVQAQIIRFNDVSQMEVRFLKSVQLIVFAGPSYSSRFPKQLQETVPLLHNQILNQNIICTCLTTCRFMESGGRTIQAFDKQLKEVDIQTISGLVIHHEFEDKDWQSKVQQFVVQINKAIDIKG